MNLGLVLKSEFDRQKHLFSQIYKTLNLSPEKKETHQQEIIQLAKEQIKIFGGNFLDPIDQKRAFDRVLKLINLGLEYASRKTGVMSNGEILDLIIAKKILENKSLVQLYRLGYQLFEDDGKKIIDILEKSEIKVRDLFFRLISSAEYTQLKSLVDIEYCNGTLAEHNSAIKTAFDLSKKYEIIPFLPIDDLGFTVFKNLGSGQKGIYPISDGLIDCLLLSLLVACMFRNEDDLFNSSNMQVASEFLQTLNHQKNQSKKELEWAIQAGINFKIAACEDRKYRALNPEFQKMFFADILTVSPEEVAQFADMLFFESSIFAKKVVQIEHFFLKYFHLVQETLYIKEPAHFDNIIINVLHSTERKIAEEVKNFYLVLDDVNITNEEISKFWHQRVCFESRKNEGNKEGVASKAQSEIQPKQLVQMPIGYIVAATRHFVHWPEEKKKEFIDNLNPNRFINEDSGNSDNLIQFFKYISSGMIGGDAIYQEETAICKKETSWIEVVMGKINWTRAHPSIVAEIWAGSDDEIRNALFEHREKFKTTCHALKTYYLSDLGDQRLFEYLLDKVAKEDSMKESAWNSLVHASKNLKSENIVMSKRREWGN